MTDHEDDLPQHLARLMRDVPPADAATREAHIAAALAVARPASERVVRLAPRRRVFLAVAAAGIAVLGAATGWAARGQQDSPFADPRAATATATDGTGTETHQAVDSTVPGKGSTPTTGTFTTVPPCTEKMNPDAVYLGEYVGRAGDITYLLFRQNETLVFVDKSTCAQVWLSAVTTVP